MKVSFSNALAKKLADDKMQEEVFEYLTKLNWFSTFIYWAIDSKFSRGVNLKEWCLSQLNNPDLIKIVQTEKWSDIESDDDKAKAILRYWQNLGKGGMIYDTDIKNYGKTEYWATIQEILSTRKDDCDGFANVVFHSLLLSGVPVFRFFIVAGNVDGGGHCYVVYRADNGLEYPLDGCYWTAESLRMKVPYCMREEYFRGESEWFRFSSEGMYKLK